MRSIGEVGILGRRACAAVAMTSAGLHAAMLGHATNVVAAALLVSMIAACLSCARGLWREGTDRAWTVVALMNLAMVAVHLPAPSHHHGASAVAAPPLQPDLMTIATAVALFEVLAATAVLCGRTRGRLARLSGTPDRSAAGPGTCARTAPAPPR